MSAEPLTAVSDLPPRTWRQWWKQLPGYWRIGAWAALLMLMLHFAVALRIFIGLIESSDVQRLRHSGCFIAYTWDDQPQRFPWQNVVWGGLLGRSARNVTEIEAVLKFDDDGLKHIGAHYPNLTSLKLLALSDRPLEITNDGVAALRGCPKLTQLDLSNSNIDDEGIRQLVGLNELSRLNLWDTLVTNDLLPTLPQFPKLRYVNVSRTDVTIEAVHQFEREYPPGRLAIQASRSETSSIIDGTIRWADGSRAATVGLKYRLEIVGPTDFGIVKQSWTDEKNYLTRLRIDLSALNKSFMHDWTAGEYVLKLHLGNYDAEPVTVIYDNGQPTPNRIEFHMPCTKAEALK